MTRTPCAVLLFVSPATVFASVLPPATQAFLDTHPGAQAMVTTTSQGPSVVALYGVALATNSGSLTTDEFVQSFVDNAANRDAFGFTGLVLVRDDAATVNIRNNKFRVYTYKQHIQGTEVIDSFVKIPVRLPPESAPETPEEIGYVGIRLKPPTSSSLPADVISEEAAKNVVRSHPDYDHLDLFTPGAKKIVLDGTGAHCRAWTFTAYDGDESYLFYVDTNSGALIQAQSNMREIDVSGNVRGFRTPGIAAHSDTNPPASPAAPLPGALVAALDTTQTCPSIQGAVLAATAAGTQGQYAINGLPSSSRITGQLSAWVEVHDCSIDPDPCTSGDFPSGILADTECLLATSSGTGYDLEFNSEMDEFSTAQVNAYLVTLETYDWLKSRQPSSERIDAPIIALVNHQHPQCVSSYLPGTPPRMVFSASRPNCNNAAFSTIISHEFGHFILDKIIDGSASFGFDEGVPDTLAALMWGTPLGGLDYHDDGLAVRNVDTPDIQLLGLLYDFEDCAADGFCSCLISHCAGLALSGAFWDARSLLVDTPGVDTGVEKLNKLFADFLFVTDGVLDQSVLLETMIVDDNDSDICNGTPNSAGLIEGFGRHGFVDPCCKVTDGLAVTWLGPPAIPGPQVPLDYTVFNAVTDGVCGEITLYTKEKDGQSVQQWRIGRRTGQPLVPADVGHVRAVWPSAGPNSDVNVWVGDDGSAPTLQCGNLGTIDIPRESDTNSSSIRLDLAGDLQLYAHPTASTTDAGGRISGNVAGFAREINATAIGSVAGGPAVLSAGTITKRVIVQNIVSATTFNVGGQDEIVSGELYVPGASQGTVTVRGDMDGPIRVDGEITGNLSVRGDFNGNICASNLSSSSPLPSNVDIVFGPDGKVCGASRCSTTVAAPLVEPSAVSKNRYISFQPPAGVGPAAIRVTLVSLGTGFLSFDGQVRWVGTPSTSSEGPGGGTFAAAPLQCTPLYQADWGAGVIHVYGAEILPGALYEIQMVREADNCGSDRLEIATGKWGDVVSAFGGSGQPNFLDVSAVVDKFRAIGGAVSKTRAQLQPNIVVPDNAVNFLDIAATVGAFRGEPYPFAGPNVCP